jgi:hypothetical protein
MDTPAPDNNLSAMRALDIVENAAFRIMTADRPSLQAGVMPTLADACHSFAISFDIATERASAGSSPSIFGCYR